MSIYRSIELKLVSAFFLVSGLYGFINSSILISQGGILNILFMAFITVIFGLTAYSRYLIFREDPKGIEYDRYKGIAELMPLAEGVSAKSREFDEIGNEVSADYLKIMKIIKDAWYKGFVSIEYEGSQLSED
jgi:hypothetical protein